LAPVPLPKHQNEVNPKCFATTLVPILLNSQPQPKTTALVPLPQKSKCSSRSAERFPQRGGPPPLTPKDGRREQAHGYGGDKEEAILLVHSEGVVDAHGDCGQSVGPHGRDGRAVKVQRGEHGLWSEE